MIDAIITQKKWLNEALTTQELHRNHVDQIKQSTDEPVLELLLNLAHAALAETQELLLAFAGNAGGSYDALLRRRLGCYVADCV